MNKIKDSSKKCKDNKKIKLNSGDSKSSKYSKMKSDKSKKKSDKDVKVKVKSTKKNDKDAKVKTKKNTDFIETNGDDCFKDLNNDTKQKKKTGKKKKVETRSNKNSDDEHDSDMSSSIKVLDRDELRLNKLKKFYKNQHNLETFVNIVTGNFPKKNLSLRILDWFVTNYSKEKDIIIKYKNEKDSSIILFDVHNEYKNQLTAFGKKGYDQFCRSGKILYPYMEDGKKKYVETTIAQLNFFKWAITEKIINYVVKHFDEIFKHMNEAKKKCDSNKNLDSDEEESEYDKQLNKCLNSTSAYSLETELSTPVENVNILEFSSSKPKLEKYIKKHRRSRNEFTTTKAKQLNKCTGKIKIEFK